MERRLAPPREYEELLDRVTEASLGGTPPLFESKQKAMMFAAALGFSLRERCPIERKGTAIREDIFQKALDDGFVDALAVTETGQLQVLGADRASERATIFEEYAHRGLQEIKARCYDAPGDPLTALIQMTEDAMLGGDPGAPGIDPGLLNTLIGSMS